MFQLQIHNLSNAVASLQGSFEKFKDDMNEKIDTKTNDIAKNLVFPKDEIKVNQSDAEHDNTAENATLRENLLNLKDELNDLKSHLAAEKRLAAEPPPSLLENLLNLKDELNDLKNYFAAEKRLAAEPPLDLTLLKNELNDLTLLKNELHDLKNCLAKSYPVAETPFDPIDPTLLALKNEMLAVLDATCGDIIEDDLPNLKEEIYAELDKQYDIIEKDLKSLSNLKNDMDATYTPALSEILLASRSWDGKLDAMTVGISARLDGLDHIVDVLGQKLHELETTFLGDSDTDQPT